MRKILVRVLVVLAVVAIGVAAFLHRQVHDLETVELADDVLMISGLGSNVGILRTELGAVVVDTMTFRSQGARVRAAAEGFAGGDVVAVVNTHYHLDHTHGNPAFDAGVDVISSKRTRHHMTTLDADYWQGSAASVLPDTTFDEKYTLTIGGKTVECLHLGRGHTDGDIVVRFVDERIVHTGDLFFNGRFPNIDLEAGGSVREWPATIDRILELDFDRLIPGHGPATDRAGLERFRAFMVELGEVGRRAADAGWSLERTLAETELTTTAGMEDYEIPFVLKLDRDFVVRRAWEEATGAVTAP